MLTKEESTERQQRRRRRRWRRQRRKEWHNGNAEMAQQPGNKIADPKKCDVIFGNHDPSFFPSLRRVSRFNVLEGPSYFVYKKNLSK